MYAAPAAAVNHHALVWINNRLYTRLAISETEVDEEETGDVDDVETEIVTETDYFIITDGCIDLN